MTKTQYRKKLIAIAGAVMLLLAAAACGKAGGESVQRLPTSQGDPDAQVVIMSFTDFQCTLCKQFNEDVLARITSEFVDTGIVRLQHRHYATLGTESVRASVAAECAAEQNRFRDYHDGLFAMQGQPNTGTFSDEALRGLARSLGLNETAFNLCFDNSYTQPVIDADIAAASNLGLTTAPTLVINGIVVTGFQDYEKYQTAIGLAWIAASED